MARYPMRSSWRAYQPGAQGGGTLRSRGCCRRFRRASSGSIPGRLRTGYGVIDCAGGTLTIVAQGCIATSGGRSPIACG